MAKITREQFDKWSAQLPQGWKFDLQKFVMWGEKQVFTDGPADETPTEAAQEAAQELTEQDEAPTEAADAAQETPTEAEPEPVEAAQEAAPELDEETDEAPTAPGYSFAELAAAYIAGRTVKARPREEAKPEPTPEPVEAAQEAAPEPIPEPEPEPAHVPGYSGNANALFTVEERQALTAGNVVISGKGYRREAYFTAHYSEGVNLVYSVYAGDVRDRINPGSAPRYVGFMVGLDLYTNAKGIAEKLREDINARLLTLVPDEETAESLTGSADEWSRGEIERLKVQSFTGAARDLFYRGEKPALILCTETPQDINDLIQYIQEPERVIELYALEHISARPETIYKSWIRYNREQAEYNALVNDPSREEHEWLRIARAIGEQKTVRVLLECGEEVRIEASAVKRVPYNRRIYDTWVVASDRHKLRGANGRTRDIDASEIVAISHGNRVLYQRAAKLEKKTA